MESLSANVAIFLPSAIAPGLLMLAGHYFPWHHTPLGKLTENQSRIYGVLGIILPVMASVALGDTLGYPVTGWMAVALFWVAAFSAGGCTVWAWGFDAHNQKKAELEEEKHRTKLLKDHIENYAEERNIH